MNALGEHGRPAPPDAGEAHAIEELEVLITAEEAYPALERLFLGARREITASFRVFDLLTRLRSEEGKRVGRNWLDLFVATLDRGVAIRLVVCDFDPVAAPWLHQLAWRTRRQVEVVRRRARAGARLELVVAQHSACTGCVPKALFYPIVRRKMREVVEAWREMTATERTRFRKETPRLQELCHVDTAGGLRFSRRMVDIYPATHHQKIALFDGETAYIGGLDLNERRYDTKRHRQPPEETWHDVQVVAKGPVTAAVGAHLEGFLDTVAGRTPAPPAAPGFLRTLSRRRKAAPARMSPEPVVNEIERRHLEAIAASRRLIYLETQFLRHIPLARALARRAHECPDLSLIVVLPAAPEDIAFSSSAGLDARFGEFQQVRCLAHLQSAFHPDRLLVCSPVQPRRHSGNGRDTLRQAPQIYVHSKVSIFDDALAIVSSANLNGRSMRWDTEAGLCLTRPEHVAQVRRRVMGHWLPKDADPAFLDPRAAFSHWRRLVEANSAAPPEARRGFLVRYDSEPAREAAQPVPILPEEIV